MCFFLSVIQTETRSLQTMSEVLNPSKCTQTWGGPPQEMASENGANTLYPLMNSRNPGGKSKLFTWQPNAEG